VQYEGQSYDMLKLYVVSGGKVALLGRDWLQNIRLNWQQICCVHSVQPRSVSELKDRFAELFETKLGKLSGFSAKLHLKDTNATPVFLRARPVPYAMRTKVELELDRLEQEGVLSKCTTSEWATPIVPIVKSNNQIRLCGDYKTTVNPALKVDKYPLPKPQDIFASLAGGEKYTKLDLRQAYLQCTVDDETKELLTLNTHKGLYKMNRLAFGIASAPSIWQQKMDQMLQGIPYCHCILDDILLSGRNDDEHLQVLEEVLKRLSAHGLRLNEDKCAFLQDRLEYCGHDVTKDGIQQSKEKTAAIVNAPQPTNVSQLRSFLGMVTDHT